MNQKQRAKWERTRAKGKRHYIVMYGLSMAVGIVVVTALLDYLIHGSVDTTSLLAVATAQVIFGPLWARWSWNETEHRYHDSRKSHLE